MAACATQAGPSQQLNLPKSVPGVTKCGVTPAVVFPEEVSPQAAPKRCCGELATGCLQKVLPQGPSAQGKPETCEEAAQGGQDTRCLRSLEATHNGKMNFQA